MSKPISETISSTSHLDLPKTDSWGNEVDADGKPIKYLRGDPYADATAKHNGGVHVQEVRPTFEELNSIERHRREILLRVSVGLCRGWRCGVLCVVVIICAVYCTFSIHIMCTFQYTIAG